MSGKIVCPSCGGNGYRTIYKDASWKEKTQIDCNHCNNQGEVEINEHEIESLLKNTTWRNQ